MILKTHLRGKVYEFKSLREVMGKANEEKSGDNLAGVSAESAEERIAAKAVLQHITLKDLFENPAVPYETDEVTRIIIDGIDPIIYRSIQSWTVAELWETEHGDFSLYSKDCWTQQRKIHHIGVCLSQ